MPIRIPNRFESVLAEGLEPRPLILPVDGDLALFERARAIAEGQAAGVLVFSTGTTGIGKTTAAYSATVHLSDRFTPLLLVPYDVPLREVSSWIVENLPGPEAGKHRLVLIDGREATDDMVGLRELFAQLNQLCRRRSDLLLVWPTTDNDWHAQLVSLARRIGGETLVPDPTRLVVSGPPPDEWPTALERILGEYEVTKDELSLSDETITDYAIASETIGRFLGSVNTLIIDRVDKVQLGAQLPEIVFVITSVPAVVGEANRLRRAPSLILRAEELMQYSPRSKAGKWWRSRREDPRHHLGYVISLFRARLATMSASSLAYAALMFGNEPLESAVRSAGLSRSLANTRTTFGSTDFCKLLSGTGLTELTSTRKGRTADTTLAAFDAVQRLSATHHKAINQAICHVAEEVVPEFKASVGTYEADLGKGSLFADAVVPLGSDDLTLEFHHVSEASCSAATMAAYVMEKLQYYAIHYHIVPR